MYVQNATLPARAEHLECAVDFVCFGNHETDVPHAALLQRIAESKFTWINTNIASHPAKSYLSLGRRRGSNLGALK